MGNKVAFNGSSYVCKKACTGIAPTNTTYWLLIAQKGTDGKGAGDMVASVYDPQGKKQDVFQYADAKASAAKSVADTAQTGLNSHIASKSNPHGVTAAQVGADPKGAADTALTNAKKYTDDKIAAIPTPDVSGQINIHNSDSSAHQDIRNAINTKAPAYTYGTTDLTVGSSSLETGKLYFVYE